MTQLTQERALEIIKSNIQTVYHLPRGYWAVNHYLGAGGVRRTLLQILQFLRTLYEKQDGKNHIVIDEHRYEFFLHNNRLAYGIRGSSGTGTANRHINFLCALGIFRKINQTHKDRLKINDNFKAKKPDRREISVYSFRELTSQELQRIEERAERLYHAGITVGNISFNSLYLARNDLTDIAREVYPKNAKSAPERKLQEYLTLQQCIDMLIEQNGYATRQQINDNLTYTDQEITKLYKIFGKHLELQYSYHRPSKLEMQQYQLRNHKFIYTRKGEK